MHSWGWGAAQARCKGSVFFKRKFPFTCLGGLPHCQQLSLPQHVSTTPLHSGASSFVTLRRRKSSGRQRCWAKKSRIASVWRTKFDALEAEELRYAVEDTPMRERLAACCRYHFYASPRSFLASAPTSSHESEFSEYSHDFPMRCKCADCPSQYTRAPQWLEHTQ